MEVTFKCNHCLKTIEADSEISGDRAACPACGEIVLVPYPGIVQGTEINGFKVIDKIGSGGMGEVFKANQVAMDRIVALKVLPPALTNDQKTVDEGIKKIS